jgi:hypothetical protein
MRRRPPHRIDLPNPDRHYLETLARNGRTPQRVARRARILLAMSNPATVVQDLAQQWEQARHSVWYLCRRYEAVGVVAVFDAPRAGRPRQLSPPTTGAD